MANKIDYYKALLNGNSNKKGQRKARPDIKPVNTHEVVELLKQSAEGATTHPILRQGAKELLTRMTTSEWRVNAPQHTGGRPDSEDPDDNLHITVNVPGFGGCHLRLTRDGYIRQITLGGEDKSPGKPWQAPGTPNE